MKNPFASPTVPPVPAEKVYFIDVHLTKIERQALEYWRKAFDFKGTDGQLIAWLLCVAMRHPATLEAQMNAFFEYCEAEGVKQGDFLSRALQAFPFYRKQRLTVRPQL